MKNIENTEVNSKPSVVTSVPIFHGEIEEEGTDSASTRNEEKAVAEPALTIAMVLSDPPPPAHKKSSDDMIDFLSVALSPARSSPSNVSEMSQGSSVGENQQLPSSSYVVPWASPSQSQPELEAQSPFQVQQQSDYNPPPWAPTPGYYCNPYASPCSGGRSAYYNNGPSAVGLNQNIHSYRLFEDLNVLGNVRTTGAPGTSAPSMVRK
ncbi:hypothetical protein L1887_14607 [Cichorium endivia]|nr:hypothetical protein L1887_14607 [Cichorium endivia]